VNFSELKFLNQKTNNRLEAVMSENNLAKTSTSAKDSAKEKEKNLSLAIGQIEKDFGKGSIMRMGDESLHFDVPVIPTGALSLDIAIGIGGVPRGRIVEIYGPESSGKSTLCLHIIANAQKTGGVGALIDAEHAFDPQYAKKIGVDLDSLLISQPDCGEDALNITDTLIRSNAVDVVVIDSVAALVPKAEIEGQMGDSFIGVHARLMSQALRKLTGAVSRSKTCCIFTNQIREKIGVMFGSPETTTGGNALKFYSSVRLDIRRATPIKDSNGVVTGNRTRVKVVKNKLAPPFRLAEFDINYAEGISFQGSVIDVALDMLLIEKKGSWFFFEGEQLGQGKDAIKSIIAERPEIQEKILTKIKDTIGVKKTESK
jgi:recombination protein RecA